MIGGVNFQPGGGQDPQAQGEARPPQGSGVQEAIRILSLRLPKVVGAQSLAPMALLSSEGSGDNPRVDSVVSQVLARMFPTGAPTKTPAPMLPRGTEPTSDSMPLPNTPMAPNLGNDWRPYQPQTPTVQAPPPPPKTAKPVPRITPGYVLPDVVAGLGGSPPPLTWPELSSQPEPQRPDFI